MHASAGVAPQRRDSAGSEQQLVAAVKRASVVELHAEDSGIVANLTAQACLVPARLAA